MVRLPRVTLTERQQYDLELLLVGAFAPLSGFLTEEEYAGVVERMRLPSGALWPMPVVLDQPADTKLAVGDEAVLCDEYGTPIAYFKVTSRYTPDREREALAVYGVLDREHPGVRYLLDDTGPVYLGGPVELIELPRRFDFAELRRTPAEVKDMLAASGAKAVVGFQTRNPIHRAHFDIMERAVRKVGAGARALIHPVVGLTKEGDIDYVTRVRAYKKVHEKHACDFAELSLLPLAMRMAGPREALWHALIRRNYGCTHFIVGRDHAGPSRASGEAFYGPYDAQQLAVAHENDLGIGIIPAEETVFVEEEGKYVPRSEVKEGQTVKNISGTKLRAMMRAGEDVPEWFSFPEVVDELRRGVRREARRGAVVFFTGLSGAGKSTVAHTLYHVLLEKSDRTVTLLDGDVIRRHLSKGLGFSREDRDTNIERIGFVASEIAKHGGIALCAAIAPYARAREHNRALAEKAGGRYVEVFVDTPLAECERRDTKGLYRKAHQGLLPQFTGVDDPYEVPEHPDLVVDTAHESPSEAAQRILSLLADMGVIE